MHDDHDEFGGLHRDLGLTGVAIGRRQLLRFGLGAGALYLLGCGNSTGTDDTDGSNNGACSVIPQETAGPFPGDGSNGPSVLNQTGVVRSDIRSSFAGLSGTADGVPLSIVLTIVSASGACAPLSGRAVYVWHCDRLGRYSLYSSGATNQNYLRGVQDTDANGKVTFTSIFPACYQGRWPHVHFEIYPSLSAATSVSNKISTSQLALPKDVCDSVYALATYSGSAANLSQVGSLTNDMIFADSSAKELATMTGSIASGFSAALTIGV